MSDFPENDLEVALDYVPVSGRQKPSEVLDQVGEALRASLAGPGIQSHYPRPNGRELTENRAALSRAHSIARVLNVEFTMAAGDVLDALDDVYLHMLGHAFEDAGTSLASVPLRPNTPTLKRRTLREALARDSLSYVEIKARDLAPGEPDDEIFDHTLKGYEGPDIPAIAIFELVYGGPERDFRLGLLSAEISFGQENFEQGLATYKTLLNTAPEASHQRKFIAIRQAFLLLSLGDSILRQVRRPIVPDPSLLSPYNDAIRVLADNAVSPDNPLAKEVTDYAMQQISKINGGLNDLGYNDDFVPIETWTFLLARAEDHLQIATHAAGNYETYLSRANLLEDVESELAQEISSADDQLKIADQLIQNADTRIAAIDATAQAISDRQSFLTAEAIQQGASAYLSAALFMASPAAAGPGAGAAVATGVVGFSGDVISHLSRANELDHQRASAQIQRRLAEGERSIEILERSAVESRRNFLAEKLKTTVGRDLNKELYYRLAGYFADLTASQYRTALRFTYLAERAVAFRFRKPVLRVLQNFSYRSSAHGIVTGVNNLRTVVATLKSEAVSSTEVDSFIFHLSLCESYPLEFSRFQQTGKLQFEVSLYDLDTARPGVYDARIINFSVKPIGLSSVTGYSGTLTHPGSFLSRDLASTLAPSTQRFIPTPTRLADEIASHPNGMALGVPVDGVVPYQLDADIKQLSVQTEEFTAPGGLDVDTVKLFERYGPATFWTLELQDLDPRLIDDFEFKLLLEHPETNMQLKVRIRELLDAYEKELVAANGLDTATDRIRAISLRSEFFEDFLDLENGRASFELKASHFPFGVSDMKLKSLVFQTVDVHKSGVAGVVVRLTKEDSNFSLERTSAINGFSEDVSGTLSVLEAGERFPVLGRWQVELPRPEQFLEVFRPPQGDGDLHLFFVYEYTRSEEDS